MIKSTIKKLLSPLLSRMEDSIVLGTVQKGLSMGGASAACRVIQEDDPISWEFSGFSQNGEDGIIDFITRKIKNPNKYFVEIGAADGLANNSAWLAYCRKFSGLMIDANSKAVKKAKRLRHNLGVSYECSFVDQTNIVDLKNKITYSNPDFFSLDIDGNDYFLAKAILDSGIRPKLFVVEYNSAYGPDAPITIEYDKDFVLSKAHDSHLYYGVAIQGWKNFFESQNYQFVTVDSNGVNAFFIDKDEFESAFLKTIENKGLTFKENFYQFDKFRGSWEKQFALIEKMPFFKIK